MFQSCAFVAFPYGVLGQMWYLVVSINDLCLLPNLVKPRTKSNYLRNELDFCRGDRGWLMHFLVFLGYLVDGMTKYDHFCIG